MKGRFGTMTAADEGGDAAATPASRRVLLLDGTVVDIVAIGPGDAERLVRFHHTLSSETTYRRFFAFHPELSAAEVYRFTHVDHRDREAVVAVADGEIVAVARFDRLENPSDAEVAFVVADSWQGRGLGTLLFKHLTRRARDLGVARFAAETLAHNHPMLALFHHAGLPVREHVEAGVAHLAIDLGEAAEAPL